jgi:hypothetical protein
MDPEADIAGLEEKLREVRARMGQLNEALSKAKGLRLQSEGQLWERDEDFRSGIIEGQHGLRWDPLVPLVL